MKLEPSLLLNASLRICPNVFYNYSTQSYYIVYSENYDLYTLTLVSLARSLDKFPTMLFITKATPFITNDSVHVESPQAINEYHNNSFNYSYYIHIISKGFIHVNSLEGAHTHRQIHTRPAQKRF